MELSAIPKEDIKHMTFKKFLSRLRREPINIRRDVVYEKLLENHREFFNFFIYVPEEAPLRYSRMLKNQKIQKSFK